MTDEQEKALRQFARELDRFADANQELIDHAEAAGKYIDRAAVGSRDAQRSAASRIRRILS